MDRMRMSDGSAEGMGDGRRPRILSLRMLRSYKGGVRIVTPTWTPRRRCCGPVAGADARSQAWTPRRRCGGAVADGHTLGTFGEDSVGAAQLTSVRARAKGAGTPVGAATALRCAVCAAQQRVTGRAPHELYLALRGFGPPQHSQSARARQVYRSPWRAMSRTRSGRCEDRRRFASSSKPARPCPRSSRLRR